MAAAPAVAAVLLSRDPFRDGAATVAIVVPPLVDPAGGSIERSRAASDFKPIGYASRPPRKAPGKQHDPASQRQGKA